MVFLTLVRTLKQTTGLTGLAVHPDAPKILRMIYGKILYTLDRMPPQAAYRRYTAAIVGDRLAIVEANERDVEAIEKKINCGQVEELIKQAEAELFLARKMVKWKPWEPLIEEAPKDQWKWPIN